MRYYHKNGLVLTKIEKTDIDLLKKLKDESWFGTHTVAIINSDDQERWYNSTSVLVLKAYDAVSSLNDPVGIFKIDNQNSQNRTASVGWDIFSKHRGKGHGKTLVKAGVDMCFEILNTHRLDAEILENNVASQKCAQAAGFVLEGCRRKAVYRCGQYIDSFFFGILKSEWSLSVTEVCNNSFVPKDGTQINKN